MTQGQRLLPDRLLDALIDAGTWRTRGDLQAAAGASAIAVEDAMADLVIEQRVDYRENVGYRLAGTQACRRAAQLLRREGKSAAVIGMPAKDGGYRVGVAETRAGVGLVMYELALPLPAPDQDVLEARMQAVGGVLKFIDKKGAVTA